MSQHLPVRAAIASLAFVGFGVLAMACTRGGSGGDAVAPDTLQAAETATTAPPAAPAGASSTVAPTPADTGGSPVPASTAVSAGRCAGVEVVPSAVAEAVATIEGDWNGDGVADSAVSWREPNGGGWRWFVRTEISGGAGAAYELGDLGVGFARVLGKLDVDGAASTGGSRDEILAVTGASAAGYQLGVFGTGDDGCVFRFDDGFGGPFVMPVTGGGTRLAGVRCDSTAPPAGVVELEAISNDGLTWGTYDRPVSRSGATTLVVGEAAVSILAGTDAGLAAYGQAGCNGQVYLDESRRSG